MSTRVYPSVVALDECEMQVAEAIGMFRHRRVRLDGLGTGHGEPDREDYMRHFLGARGEQAVSKAIGCYYGGRANDFGRAGDVGDLEVRTTLHRRGHLVVYADDPLDRPIELVVLREDRAQLVGYTTRRAAETLAAAGRLPAPQVRANSPAQFWIPQEFLASGLPSPSHSDPETP